MNSQNTPATYIPMLTSAGYKPTHNRSQNQFAKFDPIANESQVIYLSLDGSWKIYNENGVQVSHGNKIYELKACIL